MEKCPFCQSTIHIQHDLKSLRDRINSEIGYLDVLRKKQDSFFIHAPKDGNWPYDMIASRASVMLLLFKFPSQNMPSIDFIFCTSCRDRFDLTPRLLQRFCHEVGRWLTKMNQFIESKEYLKLSVKGKSSINLFIELSNHRVSKIQNLAIDIEKLRLKQLLSILDDPDYFSKVSEIDMFIRNDLRELVEQFEALKVR